MSYAVGVMSGTSLDGVDAALVNIQGINEKTTIELIDFVTIPIDPRLVKRIKQAFSLKDSHSALISSLNVELGYLFADAVKKVCKQAGISLEELTFVASHGQTIYHIPKETKEWKASTLQIGESSILAEETKTTVISDFRTRDMAVGGQGAPIVPYSEYVMYRNKNRTRLLQNIGGIGNVTVIPANATFEELVAFDTGPGNMVINEVCQHFYQEPFDKNGKYAAQGEVNQLLLDELMSHPFIQQSPPKTTGREEFGSNFVEKLLKQWNLKANDWIATATSFTAKSIAQSVLSYRGKETDLIIGGGGSHNPTLIQMIQKELPEINVLRQEDLGYSSDAKEAIAMAVLGNQTLHRQISNVPSATGAEKVVILGKITYYD